MKQFSKRLSLYLFVCIVVLVMSWEYQNNASASMINQSVGIPEESIRLRVLAHNDLPREQWLKREVRDVIVEQISEWVADIKDIEQAREYILASEDQLNDIVRRAIQERGYAHDVSIDYGQIAFPAKLYGNQLYPAGEYEGLLVTIGAGQGDNWWCVLFPPLCFVDFGTGDVMDEEEAEQQAAEEKQSDQVEVRFFIFELLAKIKSWFA